MRLAKGRLLAGSLVQGQEGAVWRSGGGLRIPALPPPSCVPWINGVSSPILSSLFGKMMIMYLLKR